MNVWQPFKKIDSFLLIVSVLLIATGTIAFLSASMGLATRSGATISQVISSQIGLGLIGGLIAMYAALVIPIKWYKTYSFYIFIAALVFTGLTLIPHIGFFYNGARRWINIAGFSIQPSELLKIAYFMYVAAWLAKAKQKLQNPKFGLIPFLIISGIPGLVLLAQPDTDTYGLMVITGVILLFLSGAPLRHIIYLVLMGMILFAALVYMRPYLLERIKVFVQPTFDAQGAGYQVQQSLIAIGSGRITGKGFGQSVQKYKYLPEPIGDSIFAVIGEEFGFIGTIIFVVLFTLFGLRGLKVAMNNTDVFSRLLGSGIVILMVSQSFLNIASMIGLAPLSGLPLVFVSHGGTALAISLFELGILLQISKHAQLT